MSRPFVMAAGLLVLSGCLDSPTETAGDPGTAAHPSLALSAPGIQAIALGGGVSRAYAINEAGFIVGGVDGNGIAATWTGPNAFDVVGPGIFSQFLDVNDQGEAVGYFNTGGAIHAMRWTEAGGIQDIGTLRPGSYTYAHGINNLGQIVGNDQQGGQRPYLWSPSTGMTALTILPGAINGIAFDINDAGMVVGESHGATGINNAVLWTTSGAVSALGSLGGTVSTAYGINSSGQVVGWSTLADGQRQAYIWSQATGMVDLNTWGTPCAGASEAESINDAGVVVGECEGRPVIWTAAHGMQELGTPDGGSQGRAHDINSHGQIVGTFGYIGAATWIVDQTAEASIALDNLTHTYDGTAKAATATTSPVGLSGVTITYTKSGSPVASPTDAGSYEVVATLDNPGYEAPDVQGTLEIGQATPTVIWNAPSPIVLGSALSGAQLNATATGAGGVALAGQFAYTPAAGTVLAAGAGQVLQVQFAPTDPNYSAAAGATTLSVVYAFTGFLQPVDNLPVVNRVNSGRAIPVKFKLGGNQGLDVFQPGSPNSGTYSCGASAEDPIEATVTASTSSLSYDAVRDEYTYVWKTETSWANSCRKLVVTLTDGTAHEARFHFVK